MSPKYVSRYEARVDLVRQTLQDASKLDAKSAEALAVRVVHVLDHVPERVR
ncbi:DUF6307 family protein [Actinokineospora sp. G85]|uniref:DUF6307 family protein n=1 Tax=Actinokineospora sp. G85 TaxID=3406626 RepID=UPI003C75DECC